MTLTCVFSCVLRLLKICQPVFLLFLASDEEEYWEKAHLITFQTAEVGNKWLNAQFLKKVKGLSPIEPIWLSTQDCLVPNQQQIKIRINH